MPDLRNKGEFQLAITQDIEGVNLGFAWHRCDAANLAAFEGIDYTALSDIGVSYKSYRDLLFVRVKLRELAKELDERPLSKGVIRRGMERNRRVSRGEVLNISRLEHEINV